MDLPMTQLPNRVHPWYAPSKRRGIG